MKQALEELERSLESAKAALKGASDVYAAQAERELHAAQRKAGRAYEARAEIGRNVDRHRRAIAALKGEELSDEQR